MSKFFQFLISINLLILILVGGQIETLAQATQDPQPQNGNDQKGNEQKGNEAEPLRIVTNEVHLPLRVFDQMGRKVTDLMDKEALVLEGGVACPVTSLKHEPANIMLVLDLSDNLGVPKGRLIDKETSEKLYTGANYSVVPPPTARKFAEIMVRKLIPKNQISIIQYSDKAEMLQDWTREQSEAINNLRSGFKMGVKAHFYDALELAATRLQNAPKGRRVLLLVTDGVDSASQSTKKSAFEKIIASGASIYVINWARLILSEKKSQSPNSNSILSGIKDASELGRYNDLASRGAQDLKSLTVRSGGEYYQPTVVSDFMLKKPDIVVSEIDSEYTLSYLSQKDEISQITSIPEIRLSRPGLSMITRRMAKFSTDER